MTSKKDPDFAACYDLANEILIASTVIEAFPFPIKRRCALLVCPSRPTAKIDGTGTAEIHPRHLLRALPTCTRRA